MTLQLAMDLTKVVALFFSRALMAELVECQLVFVSCSQDCELKNELPGPVHTNRYVYIYISYFIQYIHMFFQISILNHVVLRSLGDLTLGTLGKVKSFPPRPST